MVESRTIRLLNTLRHQLGPPTVALDYGKLRIVAHSEAERFIRSHSAAKEPETVSWIEAIPTGAVLWDAGANIGAYSLIAASRGIQVVAFEPHPANMLSLRENQSLNNLKFHALNIALHHTNGTLHFEWSSAEAGTALHHAGDRGRRVTCFRGDHVIEKMGIPAPDFLKLDTDGGEAEILAGMGTYLDGVSSLMIESGTSDPHPGGFSLEGRWPIPGHPLENRHYIRGSMNDEFERQLGRC